jgi:flavin-dependent dehydrogenase
VLQHIKESIPAVREVLASAKQPHKWLAAGPIRPGLRRRFHDGVFSVGNAAGEAHPVVAEGISMAMQSGYLAADCLLSVDGERPLRSTEKIKAAGRRYSRAWTRSFATRIRVSSVIAYWAMRPRFVALTDPIFRSIPSLLTFGARLSGKSRSITFKEVA